MKSKIEAKAMRRLRRRKRIKNLVNGTPDRPRVVICRSLKHVSGQVIDDTTGNTLVSASSLEKEFREKQKPIPKVEMSKLVGEKLGQRIQEKGLKKIRFDRNGYLYHGRVKAFAESIRKTGIDF